MRIALIFPSGHLTSTPCIPSIAILLARNGKQVDIYTAENITTTKEGAFSIFDDVKNLKLHIYPIPSKGFWENIPLLLLGFFPWWIIKSFNKKYDIIIAAGIRALFIVGIYSIFTRRKYAYLSLELYIKKEMSSIKGKIFKRLEGFFNKRALLSIIQDEQRAKVLTIENGVKLDDILIFPNSPLKETKDIPASEDILSRYGLKGKKVVLYAGSIFAPWAMTEELIKATKDWPEGWVLLIHSRAKLSEIKKKFLPDDHIDNERIILSSEPLSEDEYEQMVRACHVGIALYDGRVSENLHYVGYSSGKIAQYLKCGKPVIFNDLPLLTELMANYKCGAVVSKPERIGNALVDIENDYETFSCNALKAYEEIFNPENYIGGIIKKLNNTL